jgi:hypothetical protein
MANYSGTYTVTHTGDGSETEFSLGFKVLRPEHLLVTVDGTGMTMDADEWVHISTGDSNKVVFEDAPGAAEEIVITRSTILDHDIEGGWNRRGPHAVDYLVYANQEMQTDIEAAYAAATGSTGGGGSTTLSGLTDTSIDAVGANEVLVYSGSDWYNRTLAEAGISSGDHGHDINDLTDVTIDGTPADAEILGWDTGSSEWINQTADELGLATGGHDHEVQDITDISIDAVGTDEVLVFSGSNWYNRTLAEAGIAGTDHEHELNDITDISIDGTPANNEVLAWDTGSSEWENQTATEAGLSEAGHNHNSDYADIDIFIAHTGASNPHTGSASNIALDAQIAEFSLHTGDGNPHSNSVSTTVHFNHTSANNPHNNSASDTDLDNLSDDLDDLSGDFIGHVGNFDDHVDVFDTHTGQTSIHFTQADISITETQVSDLGDYNTVVDFATHTGNTGNPHNVTVDGGDLAVGSVPINVLEDIGEYTILMNSGAGDGPVGAWGIEDLTSKTASPSDNILVSAGGVLKQASLSDFAIVTTNIDGGSWNPVVYNGSGTYTVASGMNFPIDPIASNSVYASFNYDIDFHNAQANEILARADGNLGWQDVDAVLDMLNLGSVPEGENGFPNRVDSEISFADSTRTISVTPTGTSFDYFDAGVRYTTTGDHLVIADTEGIHAIFYEEDTLTEAVNPSSSVVTAGIFDTALVSLMYWSTGQGSGIYVGEERHGHVMDPSTHSYLHFKNGLIYNWGLGLNTMDVDGDGDVDTAAQFGIDVGAVADEDIYLPISAVSSLTGCPIYYMEGADAEWKRYYNPGFSVRTYDGTSSTRLAWNEYDAGEWKLTEVDNSDLVLCHVFATTEKDQPLISIMGQAEYNTKNLARQGALVEIQSLTLDNILFPEIRALYTIIFQTKDLDDNAVKGRAVSTDEGDDAIDWRSEYISRVAISSSDHQSLTNRNDDDAHEQYLLIDGTRAMEGALPMAGYEIDDADSILFNLTPTGVSEEGRLMWDEDDGTLSLGMPGGNVTLQIGQEMHFRAKAGEDITNGQPVYISNAVGQNPIINLANSTGVPEFHAIGVATEDISDAQFGYVTTNGLVRGVDTSDFSDSDVLYLGTTGGTFTTTIPDTTDYAVFMAECVYSHNSEGILYVHPIHFGTVDHIHGIEAYNTVADFASHTGDADIHEEVNSTTVNAAGAVMESDFANSSVRIKTSAGAMANLTFSANSIVAMMAGLSTPAIYAASASEWLFRGAAGTLDFQSTTAARAELNVEDGADVTDATNVNAAGAVMESDYSNASMMSKNSLGSMAALSFGADGIVGRLAGGASPAVHTARASEWLFKGAAGNLDFQGTTAARTELNVEDGADVTDATNVIAAGAACSGNQEDHGDILRIPLLVCTTTHASSVNTAALTAIPWNGEDAALDHGETDGYFSHDNATNNSRITCNFTGVVKATCSLSLYSAVQRACVAAAFFKNGVIGRCLQRNSYIRALDGHNDSSLLLVEYLSVTSGQYIEVKTMQDAKVGTVTLGGGTYCFFSLERIA